MLRSLSAFRKILHSKVLFSTSASNNFEKQTPLIQKLKAEFEDISSITEVLQNKELNNINFEQWKSRMYVLKRYHFSDSDCFRMISAYPQLLKMPLENLENSVQQWFLCDIGLDNCQFLLLCQPQLIDIDVKDIRKRLPRLRIYFKTSKALCRLIASSPNVMFDNWNSLLEKLNYLTKVKKFSMMEVVNSKALSKPITFIRLRFDLLEKCGIYKQDNSPVHKINKYDNTKHKNPPLHNILNPNNLEFIKIAKISHEEYEVYKNLFFEQDAENEEEEEENDQFSYHK